MLLKVITTTLVITGLVLLLTIPFLMASKPVDGTDKELAEYSVKILLVFGATCISWLAAAISSVFLLRRTRKEFSANQKENMKGLIEGTLRDHENKN